MFTHFFQPMAFMVVEPISLIPGNNNVQSLHSQLLQENISLFLHMHVHVACIFIFILRALNKAPSSASTPFVDG